MSKAIPLPHHRHYYYIILAIATLFIVSAAWTVTAIWLLLGLSITTLTPASAPPAFEKGVLYEKTYAWEKKGLSGTADHYHDAHSEEINKLSQFAFVTASFLEAEIIAVTINRAAPKIFLISGK